MIKHTDYDGYGDSTIDYKLPKEVKTLEVSHDGGRLSICVNGEEIFYSIFGTRDCCIELDGK